MKPLYLVLVFIIGGRLLYGQTFNDRVVINSASVEMLKKYELDFRVSHRFGDMFGSSGGWRTFYGLESAADIGIGAQYGISDFINLGLHRYKGVGALKQLINGELKIRLLNQFSEKKHPLTIVLNSNLTLSTMPKSIDEESITHFIKFNHRLVYSMELLIARRFGNSISLQLNPGFAHRNLVYVGDSHDLFFIGGSGRIQMTKVLALILEYTHTFAPKNSPAEILPNAGIGLEFYTGGHAFQINFTNAQALVLSDRIFHTSKKWSEGEFRLGFSISRVFKL